MTSNWIDKQFDDLKKLADDRFAPLSEAESKMLRAAIAGDFAWCGPSQKNDDLHNDPSSAEEWGPEREIRAEVLRWLCVDKTAEVNVDCRGIKVYGAKVSGVFDLSFAEVRFPLVLNHCRFSDKILLLSTRIPELNLSGSSTKDIAGDGINVSGLLFLSGGFRANGEVSFLGGRIGGNLECDGGIFKNPLQENLTNSGTAFNAQIAIVNGSVFLRDNFEADGKVSLMGAQIGADLDCQGGRFRNPSQEGVESSGTALEINNATIKGNLLLHSGFVTEGTLKLMGTRIAGDLECHDTKFSMLVGHRMTVQRTFFGRNINNPEDATLYLKDVSVGSLEDDTVSWPKEGSLYLDGFTYGRIAGGPQNITNRLDWLSRQKEFTPQPYRQLAKILREEGDDPGARQVLYEMEKKKHQEGKHGWTARFWNLIFRGTIGYGIYPRRALWWLLLLIMLGWGTYRYGYLAGAITPTNKEAYDAFRSKREPPPSYQHFYASVYSAEHCFPLVNLGQKEAWTPDPNRLGLARFLRVFRWLQILLGWALATFFVAGVTGIARKD